VSGLNTKDTDDLKTVKKPTAFTTRKPTDENQVDRDLICPPVRPDLGKLSLEKARPGKFSGRSMRVGKS
jgi:hypothetical protein